MPLLKMTFENIVAKENSTFFIPAVIEIFPSFRLDIFKVVCWQIYCMRERVKPSPDDLFLDDFKDIL